MYRARYCCSTSSMVKLRLSRLSKVMKMTSPREFTTILGRRITFSRAIAASKGLAKIRIKTHCTSSDTRVMATRARFRLEHRLNRR